MEQLQDLYKAKRSLELNWEQEHLNEGRYTLDMVKIDHKVRQVIADIKMKEADTFRIRIFTVQSLALHLKIIYILITIHKNKTSEYRRV